MTHPQGFSAASMSTGESWDEVAVERMVLIV